MKSDKYSNYLRKNGFVLLFLRCHRALTPDSDKLHNSAEQNAGMDRLYSLIMGGGKMGLFRNIFLVEVVLISWNQIADREICKKVFCGPSRMNFEL